MSKIFDYENQVIMRFPEDVAQRLHQYFDDPQNQNQLQIDLKPLMKEENGAQKMEMKVKIDNQEFNAKLVDLPTITESYRSIDRINLFKSNDISQMIYVQKLEEQDVPPSLAKIIIIEEDGRKVIKYKSQHGLTPCLKDVQTRFYRQPIKVDSKEVGVIEHRLESILKELGANPKSLSDKLAKKYKKKF